MDIGKSLFPAVVLVICGPLGADSATVWSFDDGRTVIPITTDDIAMVAETVTVTPVNQASRWWDAHVARVDCVFHLVNAGSGTVTSEVGFPFEADQSYPTYVPSGSEQERKIVEEVAEAVASGIPADWMIPPGLNFTASVDGQQVPVRYRFGDPDDQHAMGFWPMWAVWDMEFPPGRDVVLRCSYTTGFDFVEYSGRFDCDFTYITRTGALWRGSIGSALISITVPDSLPLPGVSSDFTAWWEWTGTPYVEGRVLRWEMRDWEPDSDITLRIRSVGSVAWQVDRMEIFLDPDTVFSWESPGSLFASIIRFVDRDLSLEADASSAVREIRDAVLRDGPAENHSAFFYSFSSDPLPDPLIRSLFDELEASLEAETASITAAGYAPLMTMFAVKTNWHDTNLAMYERDPSLEARFLTALSLLEGAVSGVAPGDPVLQSFYRLTGWFLEGSEAPRPDLRYSTGFEPFIARDSVLSWWEAYPAMPLVTATPIEGPGPNVPFAFETPSPPFPVTPQVNSVLNDDDPFTGWRSDRSGAGHGEVLEAFVFPLPGPALTIDGLAVVNGFESPAGTGRPWVSKLLVCADGVPVCTAQLLEGPGWQTVAFPFPVEGAGVLSFEIIEAVPGDDGEPAGLSELRLSARGRG
jgi:hypothetical protein